MLDVCLVIFKKYSLAIIGQIMIKMAPFGQHNTNNNNNNNNKSLTLVELSTRGIMTKIAQNDWLVWIGYLQFI